MLYINCDTGADCLRIRGGRSSQVACACVPVPGNARAVVRTALKIDFLILNLKV